MRVLPLPIPRGADLPWSEANRYVFVSTREDF